VNWLGFLQDEYYGNPLSAYLISGAAFAGMIAGFLIVRRLARRSGTNLATELMEQVRVHELVLVALDLARRSLELPHRFEHVAHTVAVLVIAWRIVGLLSTLAAYGIRRTILSDPADRANQDTAHAATLAAKSLIWIGAALFVLSNAGYNVSSMVAGLGIGGIAVALAAQAVLGDLFSAVALYLDKPFVVGDFIKVGDFWGTVEHVGIKTTRVRSRDGEMLIFPNSNLTSSRIQNFRPPLERRALVNFSVPLDTPAETLRRLPEQLRKVAEKTPNVRFERAHLAQFQESGLQYEVVFYVSHPEYVVYMDRQQSVLIGLLEAMRADGIPLAQPTRTVVIDGKLP